ncbi:hypothetical protein D0B54_10630 [Solimonas sp. K1W22B-7]|nr:hypothetical protein D0B54_10630 [Solimonas sp. K1W22B-7]
MRPVARSIVALYLLAGLAVLAAAWWRTGSVGHTAVLAMAGLALTGGLVMAGLLAMMPDPRGMVFFGVFFGLVVLPHFLAFGFMPERMLRADAPAPSFPAAAATGASGAVETPLQTTDLTAGILNARRATLSVYRDGSQLIEIVYDGDAEARMRFLAEYQNQPPPLASLAGHNGVLTQEPGYSTFHSVDGAQLLRITAIDSAGIEQRLRARDMPPPAPLPPQPLPEPIPELPMAPLLAGLLVYTLFVSWVFFRLSAWAAAHPAQPEATVLPLTTLRDRLLRLAKEDIPFTLLPGDSPEELVAEWRYADATWLDLMRARHMRRLVRFRLRLDEDHAEVRVREFQAAFDASAGHGGADLRYRASWGITFFERQVEGVLGLQLRDGRISHDPAYVYRFDIEEMRAPLVQLVTGAGWSWRPVMLDARWLTG